MKAFSPFFLIFIFVPCAYAYIDPGTGSMLVQILIGAILGGIIGFRTKIKQLWDAVGSWFKRNK